MGTKQHFKKLIEIVKEEGLNKALAYDLIQTAKTYPHISKSIASIYVDCFNPKLKIEYGPENIKAIADYTGRLVSYEINGLIIN